MHSRLSSFLSSRLVDRGGGHRAAVLDLFEQRRRGDFFARKLLDQRRDEQLADLLNYARAKVPHWRALLPPGEAPIRPSEAASLLKRLPPMARPAIQADPVSFLAEGVRECVDDHTGGSTGTPLTFKVDRATQQAREASLMWANSLAGWKPGGRIAMLWGSDRDTKAAFRDWKLNLRWWLDNMRWYNAFNMGEREMRAFHSGMSAFRPHLVVAYAGSLLTYARYLAAQGIKPSYPLTALVSSAECLTPPMREANEQVFDQRVYDRYGNREAGAIAAECECHKGLHVNESDFLVEIEGDDPYRTPGALLITYCRNRAMPLIRYNTGDLATWEAGACACGRHTLRLARIVGRQSDTIRTASGNLVPGVYFTHVLYGSKAVREFQFVQEDLQHYRLLVVADATCTEDETRWRRKILEVLDRDAELVVDYVEAIPVLASGKRRFTLSKLTS